MHDHPQDGQQHDGDPNRGSHAREGGVHSHAVTGVNRGVLFGVFLLSLAYMVAEIVGGMMSGSLALLADAGHMALDAAAIALGLFAFWISKRPPNDRKTFGYYRVEILAAAANAATLMLISIWIFYEAWQRFRSPPVVQGGMMSLVAFGGLVVNAVSLILIAKSSRENLNMRGVWMHVLTDALGSVAALLAGFFIWQFGWSMADPIISVAIGLLILYGGWKLLTNCIDVLLVATPEGVDLSVLRKDIGSVPGVLEVHDLHVWAMNTGVNALSVHIRLSPDGAHADVLRGATKLLREKHKLAHVTLQLEPNDFSEEASFCAPGRAFQAGGAKPETV